MTAMQGGFNRSMQHIKFCVSGRSVVNEEVQDQNLLHG